MTNTWFTSDPHFGHAKVAELRGFSSFEDHDATIIENWNRKVSHGDTVWLLGDVAVKMTDYEWSCLEFLKGAVHLITGNHDAVFPGHRKAHKHQVEWMWRFDSIQAFARIKIAGRDVLLSHFPYRDCGDHTAEERYSQYRLVDEGNWLLHGHTHSRNVLQLTNTGVLAHCALQLHVGLDAWGLSPVDINEIEKFMRTVEEGYL